MTPTAWQLQLALGACRAGRLLAAAALTCALFALVMLVDHVATGITVRVLWSLVVLATLPALYLAVRLELDRGLFQRLVDAGDIGDDELASLDRAMVELDLVTSGGASRSLADRAGGVFRLVRQLGAVVGMQVALLTLATLFA